MTMPNGGLNRTILFKLLRSMRYFDNEYLSHYVVPLKPILNFLPVASILSDLQLKYSTVATDELSNYSDLLPCQWPWYEPACGKPSLYKKQHRRRNIIMTMHLFYVLLTCLLLKKTMHHGLNSKYKKVPSPIDIYINPVSRGIKPFSA